MSSLKATVTVLDIICEKEPMAVKVRLDIGEIHKDDDIFTTCTNKRWGKVVSILYGSRFIDEIDSTSDNPIIILEITPWRLCNNFIGLYREMVGMKLSVK